MQDSRRGMVSERIVFKGKKLLVICAYLTLFEAFWDRFDVSRGRLENSALILYEPTGERDA